MRSLLQKQTNYNRASFYGALMNLLDRGYLAQNTPTFGFRTILVLWLALGYELSWPNLGYQSARSASIIHQEEKVVLSLAIKQSRS